MYSALHVKAHNVHLHVGQFTAVVEAPAIKRRYLKKIGSRVSARFEDSFTGSGNWHTLVCCREGPERHSTQEVN